MWIGWFTKICFLGCMPNFPPLKRAHQLRHSLGYDLDDFAIAKQSWWLLDPGIPKTQTWSSGPSALCSRPTDVEMVIQNSCWVGSNKFNKLEMVVEAGRRGGRRHRKTAKAVEKSVDLWGLASCQWFSGCDICHKSPRCFWIFSGSHKDSAEMKDHSWMKADLFQFHGFCTFCEARLMKMQFSETWNMDVYKVRNSSGSNDQ